MVDSSLSGDSCHDQDQGSDARDDQRQANDNERSASPRLPPSSPPLPIRQRAVSDDSMPIIPSTIGPGRVVEEPDSSNAAFGANSVGNAETGATSSGSILPVAFVRAKNEARFPAAALPTRGWSMVGAIAVTPAQASQSDLPDLSQDVDGDDLNATSPSRHPQREREREYTHPLQHLQQHGQGGQYQSSSRSGSSNCQERERSLTSHEDHTATGCEHGRNPDGREENSTGPHDGNGRRASTLAYVGLFPTASNHQKSTSEDSASKEGGMAPTPSVAQPSLYDQQLHAKEETERTLPSQFSRSAALLSSIHATVVNDQLSQHETTPSDASAAIVVHARETKRKRGDDNKKSKLLLLGTLSKSAKHSSSQPVKSMPTNGSKCSNECYQTSIATVMNGSAMENELLSPSNAPRLDAEESQEQGFDLAGDEPPAVSSSRFGRFSQRQQSNGSTLNPLYSMDADAEQVSGVSVSTSMPNTDDTSAQMTTTEADQLQRQSTSMLPSAQAIELASLALTDRDQPIGEHERLMIRKAAEAQIKSKMEACAAQAVEDLGPNQNRSMHEHNAEIACFGYRRRCCILAFILLILTIGTILGIVFGVGPSRHRGSADTLGGSRDTNSQNPAPTLQPTGVVSSTLQPTLLPSISYDEPPKEPDSNVVCQSNNECECARNISWNDIGRPIVGNTLEATLDPTNACEGIDRNGAGVWYRIEGSRMFAKHAIASNVTTDTMDRNDGIGSTSVNSFSESFRFMASLCNAAPTIHPSLVTSNTTGTSTNYDTQISIFKGERCDRLSCLAGNDQGGGSECSDQSRASFVAEEDDTYFVYVHGFRSSRGIFSLEISEMDDNLECERAMDASSTVPENAPPTIGSTRGGTVVTPEMGNCGSAKSSAPGVWFKFEVGDEDANRLLRIVAKSITDGFMPQVSAFGGDGCGALDCIGGGVGQVEIISRKRLYYAFVHGMGSGVGDFTFEVTRRIPDIIIPPKGIFCEDATGLPLGASIKTDLLGLVSDVDAVASCGNAAIINTYSNDVFSYQGGWFNTTGTGRIFRASTCNEGTNADTRIHILLGECSNLQCIDANDDVSSFVNYTTQHLADTGDMSCSEIEWFAEKDAEYKIIVHLAAERRGVVVHEFNISLDEVDVLQGHSCEMAKSMPTDGTSVIGVLNPSMPPDDTLGPSVECQSEQSEIAAGAEMVSQHFWYEFVGDGQRMTASTCHAASSLSNSNTRIMVMASNSDSCHDLQCIPPTSMVAVPCRDHMSATWQTQKHLRYYIHVEIVLMQAPAHPQTRTPSFTLTVEPTVLNDQCQSAIGPVPLHGRSQFVATRSAGRSFRRPAPNATAMDYPTCSTSTSNPIVTASGRDVWFSVVGNGWDMIATTCSLHTEYPTQISIYRGDECNSLSCDGVVASEGGCGGIVMSDNTDFQSVAATRGSYVQWTPEMDVLYFIRISGRSLEDDYGVVDFRIGRPNDSCHRAQEVVLPAPPFGVDRRSVAVAVAGTTEGAKRYTACVEQNVWTDVRTVWYRVNGIDGTMFASTCGTDSPFQTFITVSRIDIAWSPLDLGKDCTALECVKGSDTIQVSPCNSHNRIQWQARATDTYFLTVHSLGLPFHLEVGGIHAR